MNLNNNERQDELSEEQKRSLIRDFTETGLKSDAFHLWTHTRWAELDMFDRLKPMRTYEEYITKNGENLNTAYIMSVSNKETIKKFDKVVQKFNKELLRVIEEKDKQTVLELYNEAVEIMYGSQAEYLDKESN